MPPQHDARQPAVPRAHYEVMNSLIYLYVYSCGLLQPVYAGPMVLAGTCAQENYDSTMEAPVTTHFPREVQVASLPSPGCLPGLLKVN